MAWTLVSAEGAQLGAANVENSFKFCFQDEQRNETVVGKEVGAEKTAERADLHADRNDPQRMKSGCEAMSSSGRGLGPRGQADRLALDGSLDCSSVIVGEDNECEADAGDRCSEGSS